MALWSLALASRLDAPLRLESRGRTFPAQAASDIYGRTMWNPTIELVLDAPLWLCLAALIVIAASHFRTRQDAEAPAKAVGRLWDFFSSRALLVGICGFAALRTVLVFDIAYVAPRDVVQDIVLAQQLLRNESAYPPDISKLAAESLSRDAPSWSLGSLLPRLKERELRERPVFTDIPTHPPHAILLLVPFVYLWGVHGTVLALNVVSLASLAWVLWLVRESGMVGVSPRLMVVAAATLLCWQPVLRVFWQGQIGILVAALTTLAWFQLRKNREVLAGASICIVTLLKLYPGLLFIYLALRHRRAFISGIVVAICMVVAPLPWVGWKMYADYLHIPGRVTALFARHPLNLSLFGFVNRAGWSVSVPLFAALGLALVMVECWRLRNNRPNLDVEYGIFTASSLLLSPITWDHYLALLIMPMFAVAKDVLSTRPRFAGMYALALLFGALSFPPDFLLSQSPSGWTSAEGNTPAAAVVTFGLGAFAVWLVRIGQRTPAES